MLDLDRLVSPRLFKWSPLRSKAGAGRPATAYVKLNSPDIDDSGSYEWKE